MAVREIRGNNTNLVYCYHIGIGTGTLIYEEKIFQSEQYNLYVAITIVTDLSYGS